MVESRKDEEQDAKFKEITDILLAAGYFRARIKGLPPFDKVVGGMVWCIEMCSIDIDVDLFYQDSLTIGQKISLTEKIVAVLPKMKCPHRLEPHQIQGLDFIRIFPVVQWLVKKAIETQQEFGNYSRTYAVSQFHKCYGKSPDENSGHSSHAVKSIKDIYQPRRIYKPKDIRSHEDILEDTRVICTLLEYGQHRVLVDKSSVKNKAQAVEAENTTADEKQKLESLMTGMDTASDKGERLSSMRVGSIVTQQTAELTAVARQYADLHAQLGSTSASSRAVHGRVRSSLEREAKLLEDNIREVQARIKAMEADRERMEIRTEQEKGRQQALRKEAKETEDLETEENRSTLKKLQALMALCERLSQQEKEFREHCKAELTRLQTLNRDLETSPASDDADSIDAEHSAAKEKMNRLRLNLAKKNRLVASLQRKIDDVPTRAELSQYQRRFVELYEQVAATHKETKQFFTLYNSLDDTRMYLNKELGLLNSVLDNFSMAMTTSSGKTEFLQQFEAMVEGIKQNRAKVEKRRLEEKLRRDKLTDTHVDLMEQQRSYYKTVKEFQDECRKNEALCAKMNK